MRDLFTFDAFDSNDGSTYVTQVFAPEPPTRTEEFKRHTRAGRTEDTFGGQRYVEDPGPVHTYAVLVRAATTAALETAIANLDAAVPDSTFNVRLAGSSRTVYAKVRGVDRDDVAYHPSEADGRVSAEVTYRIECEPGWTNVSGTAFAPSAIANYPGYVEVTGIPGTMPAKTDLQVTCAQALSKLFVGYASNRAVAGLQDYQGDAAHAAKCRGGEAAVLSPMTADMTAIGTADSLDSSTYEGWWAVIASIIQTDSTAADTTYRAVSRVAGSGIAETADCPTAAVAAVTASAAAADCVYLGDVPIPAAGVALAGAGSGYGAETVLGSQTTHGDAAWTTTTKKYSATFAATAGYEVTGLEFDLHAAGNAHGSMIGLFTAAGTTPLVSAPASRTATGAVREAVSFIIPTDGDYRIGLWSSSGGFTVGANGTSLYYKVYGRAPKGYNSSVVIQAKNAGGNAAYLDWTQLIPADEFFLAAYHAFSADQGVRVDSDLGDVLLTDSSDNRGFSLLYRSATDRTVPRGDPSLRPGTTRIFPCGANAGTLAPGAITVSGTYWDKWEVPPGA